MMELWERLIDFFERFRLVIFTLFLVIVIALLGVVKWNSEIKKGSPEPLAATKESTKEMLGRSHVLKKRLDCFVDVEGAVNSPGVVRLTSGQRVVNAIARAGGMNGQADSVRVNLAKKISDQMMVYVPRKGEKSSPVGGDLATTNSTSETAPVNLNSATAEQLMTVDGIGTKKAQKIVQFREEHGPFAKVSDLQRVGGFGPKSISALAPRLTVEG
ncbi:MULTISPECIES: helix-hairpin-helix domain-containing protein [unclassified Ligilactobacillus]|uniref:helix-hairpin-helix domain-containing protein n=1 Tax=unclassified Ligilactobacillus TaxID=2767920 RepID=UPI003851F619